MPRKWVPTNKPRPNKIVFVPKELSKVYEQQGEKLRIDKVDNLKTFHAQKARFFRTKAGKKFLSYKKSEFKEVQGIKVWFVDGAALRSGVEAGDVDFTMGGHAYRYLYVPRYEIWIDELYKGKHELWSIIWHEYIERALMMKGMDYDTGHTIASRLEIVLKKGDFFVLPVGTYRQGATWSCGPAAMKIVLDYLRWPVTEKYLVKLCKTTPNKGSSPKQLVQVARAMGFSAYNRKGLTEEKVKRLIRKGNPVIANFQYTHKFGEGHYAVIVGFNNENFILSDPASANGYRVVKIKDFIDKWYELEDKTVRQGIVIEVKR